MNAVGIARSQIKVFSRRRAHRKGGYVEKLAKQLFEEGKSVNAVAKQLDISYYNAQKLKEKWGGSETEIAPDQAEPTAAENLVYTVSLEVPVGKAIELIRGLPAEEILAAIEELAEPDHVAILQNVMQRRLNGVLTPRAGTLEMPRLAIAN